MNNEPVAWIIDANMTDCDDNFIWNTGGYPDWQVEDWIPLYTHPAKTLDRELLDKTIIDQQNEIKELRKNLDIALMIVNEPAKTLTEPSVKEITELWLYVVNNKPVNDKRPIEWHFANAILRKAQEK